MDTRNNESPFYKLSEIAQLIAEAEDKDDLLDILSCIDCYKYKFTYEQLRLIDKYASNKVVLFKNH